MGNTFTNLLYHLVFSTQHRKTIILETFREELYRYLGGIIRGEKGKMLVVGGTNDHVHILSIFPQSVTVSNMLQHIKGNSSKWINDQNFMAFRFRWQTGYGAFTVSESMTDCVSRYIQNQATHHKKMTFKEELIMLLEKHKIDYDERYLWD